MKYLINLATGLRDTTYLDISVYTVFVYDYLISLPDEIDYLWTRHHIGRGKVVYFLTRYLPFVSLPLVLTSQLIRGLDTKTCTSLLTAVNIFQSVMVMFSEWMFLLRTYVMWNHNKIVLAIMLASSLIAVVAITVLLVTFVPSITVIQLHESGMAGCVKGNASSIMFATYLVIIAVELVILGLIVAHVLRKPDLSHCRLLKTMMRDGAFYCVCMIMFSIINVVTVLRVQGNYSDMFSIYQTVFHTILASRLQLHLTRTNQRTHVTSLSEIGISSMVFENGVLIS